MAETLTVIGNYLSPYVRKVLVCLELKGIPYRIDPIAPFVGNEDFSRLSPLRRIPVLIEGDLVLNDSTVICEYLQDRFPAPSLYPADPVDRAKARWLEEYADSYLGDVVIWRMFFQKGVRRFLFNQGTDEEVVRRAREEELPVALDYLEPRLPGGGWIFGELSIADISIASFFRNAAFVRYQVDPLRWPRTAAFVARALALPAFARLATFEDRTLRTPLPEQRAVLAQMGAPLTETTYGDAAPRYGVMRLG
ncbi:glutathione S-transferase family protein [Pseudoxanthomonas mexicana]|uniref:glutathione S-transferase family protein n=1 Tax=Pseudoxanthomonas mexicana TaxID=128785 RepID=UPI00289F4F33|nr:glutathione S-transferase family protein [Pseudoxanthomonas mexicana]